MSIPARTTASRLWSTACGHINGLAVGSTVAALHTRGLLTALAGPDGCRLSSLPPADIRHPRLLVGALRLLEMFGWVEPTDTEDWQARTVRLTRAAAELAPAFATVPRLLEQARWLLDGASASEPLEWTATRALRDHAALCLRGWDLGCERGHTLPPGGSRDDDARVRRQVMLALDGHLAAPFLFLAARSGGHEALERSRCRPDTVGWLVARVFERMGWTHAADSPGRLTVEGASALAMAGTYGHVLAYLPTLEQVPTLLFGEPPACMPGCAEGADAETHVHRLLDVAVSGEVFTRFVAEPFLELFLPLFDRVPVADQPRVLVDVGRGDASMLRALHEGVAGRTQRGAHLERLPLLAVGVDVSGPAREAAARTLSAAGIPHCVMAGDINDPRRLVHDLGSTGIDVGSALFVCKSVVHNRAVPLGGVLSPADLERDLTEFFTRWLPFTRAHGFLVAESHTVPARVAAAHLDRSPAVALEATHLYSGQTLVEMPLFHRAAARAGFTSTARRTLGGAVLGHDYMSIDHFVQGA